MKTLLVAVDDCGLDKSVNDSIIELAQQKRINATSVMCHAQFERSGISKLKDSGLLIAPHVVWVEELAENGITSFPKTFKSLFFNSLTPTYRKFLEIEAHSQLERFNQFFGKADYFTSHQHVHLFPQLWKLCVKLCREYKINKIRGSIVLPMSFDKQGLLTFSTKISRMIDSAKDLEMIVPLGINNTGHNSQDQIEGYLELAHQFPDTQFELIFHTSTTNNMSKYLHWNLNWIQEYDLLLNTRIIENIPRMVYPT